MGKDGREISFTVYGKPEPQGSIRAFMVGGKPRLTSDNAKLKPWRQQVALSALVECRKIAFGKHEPVELRIAFYLARPSSCPKKRVWPAVKPDSSKLIRAAEDALTGIVWQDDAQVCRHVVTKEYGSPARTEITIRNLERLSHDPNNH